MSSTLPSSTLHSSVVGNQCSRSRAIRFVFRNVDNHCLASALHAVLHHLDLLVLGSQLGYLPQIAGSRQIKRVLPRGARPAQLVEVVRLHLAQVKDVVVAVAHAPPRRRREDRRRLAADPQRRFQPVDGPLLRGGEVVEAVPQDPDDAPFRHAVDEGVVLRAGEGGGVLLHGDDALPAVRQGEGDDVAARAGEDVDDGRLGGGADGAEVLGDLDGYRLGRDAEPGVVCEADVVVVVLEEGVGLVPVSGLYVRAEGMGVEG